MTRPPTRLITIVMAICCLPFLGGASGSLVFAREAIGPLVTLAVWIAILVIGAIRAAGFHLFEWMTVVGCLLVLQLLLDLHTPHLGDIVVAALHVILVIVVFIRGRRAR